MVIPSRGRLIHSVDKLEVPVKPVKAFPTAHTTTAPTLGSEPLVVRVRPAGRPYCWASGRAPWPSGDESGVKPPTPSVGR